MPPRRERHPVPSAVVVNRQRFARVSVARCRLLLAALERCTRRLRGTSAPPWRGVTVLLVADGGSAEAHRLVFDDPAPTDVITTSFVEESPDGGISSLEGELVVNVQRAWQLGSRLAARRPAGAWSPAHELALYLAHGLDHLTGADDAEPSERRRMRSRELRWVASVAPLLPGVFQDIRPASHAP